MHRFLSCAVLLAASASLSAQTVTLTSNEVLRIHFTIPSSPSPSPDVLQFGIGLVTVNSAYTTRTSRLWDCEDLLGTAVSPSFGSHVGALSLSVCNSWREVGSPFSFDNPGTVASFAPLQNATIQGIIDFELGTGSLTLDLANVSMLLVRATGPSGGTVCSPGPVIQEVVVVPKLTGPVPGTVGATNVWTTTGAAPGALMLHVLALDCSPGVIPFQPPVYFDLLPPFATFVDVADATGSSSLSLAIPSTASGILLMAQSVEVILPALKVTNFSSYTFP